MIRSVIPIGNEDIINHNIFESLVKHLLKLIDVSSDTLILKSRNSEEENRDVTLDNRRGIEQEDVVVKASYNIEIRDPGNSTFRLRSNYNTPVFGETNNFFIVPVNIGSKMTVSIQIKTNSSEEANKIYSRIKLQTRTGTTNQLHNVLFRYYLPKPIEEFLATIYEIRKDEIGDVDNIIHFLDMVKMKDITIMSNIAGEDEQIGIRDIQTDCLGGFTDNYFNAKPEYDKDAGKYVCELEYELYYDIPTYLSVSYFISIYNRILPAKFIESRNAINGYAESPMNVLNSYYEITRKLPLDKHDFRDIDVSKYTHIPKEDRYDDFTNNIGITVFSALILVNDDPVLFNVGDLGEYALDPMLLLYLREYGYQYAGNDFQDIVNISLYENNKRHSGVLEMDSELNVYSKIKLDKYNRYRVLLSIQVDLNSLSGPAVSRYKRYLSYLETEYGIGNEAIHGIDIPKTLIPIMSLDNDADTEYANVIKSLTGWGNITEFLLKRDFKNYEGMDNSTFDRESYTYLMRFEEEIKSLTGVELGNVNGVIPVSRKVGNPSIGYMLTLNNGSRVLIRVRGNRIIYILYYVGYNENVEFDTLTFGDGRSVQYEKDGTYTVTYKESKTFSYTDVKNCFIPATNALLAVNRYIDTDDGATMKTVMYSVVVGMSIMKRSE